MSFDNYRKIIINSGNDFTLYFSGSGAPFTKLFPALGGSFDARINQSDTDTGSRGLIVTDSGSVNVDLENLRGYTTLKLETPAAGGPYPIESYQVVYTEGDKILTGQKLDTGNTVQIPPTTTRIQISPFDTSVKLPVRAKDIANDQGQILDTVTIQSGGAPGTLSSQVQNLNNDGEFELTKLVKSTDTVFGATGKGLGLFQQSAQQNVSVSANFSITPTRDRIKVNSSTNDVEFTGFIYTAGGGEKITVIFENAGTNNIIVKHGSSASGYSLYLPNGEDIKVVSDYASMTFEFTTYTSVDEWQLVSYVEYGGITRDVTYTGSTINPIIELTALTNDADDYAIGDGTFFSVSLAGFYGGNDITGFAGGVDGREIEIINRGTGAIDIQHQNGGSLVTNRIISPTGADIVLNQYDTVRLRYYEGTINRWVIVGGTY